MGYDYQKYYKKTKTKIYNIDSTRDSRDVAEAEKLDKTIFGILLAILAILPLLTRTKVIDFTSPLITSSSLGSGSVGDVFTYYKFIFLVISTSTLLILFLYRTFGIGIDIKRSFINIPLAVLSLTVALSAVFAPYKTLALVGMYNRHEGAITYLCYFTLFFIAANLTYTKKMLHGVIYALYPVTIVNTVLGLLGFYGIELINNKFIQAILLPKGVSKESISAGSRFITTINHGNYVSGIAAVLLVIFMMMFILDKNKIRQAANGLLAILSFAMMLSSLSRSGFLTLVVVLPILALLLLKSERKLISYAKLAVQLVLFAGIFTVMATHNPQVWDESMGMFVKENPFGIQKQAVSLDSSNEYTNHLAGLKSNHNTIMNKETINQYTGFLKEQANKLSIVTVVAAEENNQPEQFQLPQLPQSGVGAGSGRLFIWGNALDMIKHRPILGYGLDTFAYNFPQNDPDKIANLETHSVIVDKAHNMYINMAYSSGIIALLALVALLAAAFVKNLKIVFTQKANCDLTYVFFSLFVGWMAYLVQALVNDSVIGSAPIFWIIVGTIISIDNFNGVKNKPN